MNRYLSLLMLGALSSQLLLASNKPDQQEAIRRMQQAVAKTNIFELPSFVMKAAVEVEIQGKPVEGTYQLLWNGPDQWREEVSFPGYSEVQVGGKANVWIQRNTDFIPIPVYHLRQALGFGSNLGGGGGSSLVQLDFSHKVIKKQRERNEHGTKLTCFEMEDEEKHTSETCLNETTGLLSRNSPYHAEEEIQPIGGKVFPRVFTAREAGKLTAKVSVSELTTPGQFPLSAFIPPTGVAPQQGCMNPTPPHLAQRVHPEYPMSARTQHVEGSVKMDVFIGTDGIVRIRKLLEAPSSDLEASAQRAIEAWRYDPAACSGRPVQDSTILQVNYALSH